MAKTVTFKKTPYDYTLLQLSTGYQRRWMNFATWIHGMHAGICLAHYLFITLNKNYDNSLRYTEISRHHMYFIVLFTINVVLCLVAVFDKYDIAHLDIYHIWDLCSKKKTSVVILIHLLGFICHLIAKPLDEEFIFIASVEINPGLTNYEEWQFFTLSSIRALTAVIAWFFMATCEFDDMLNLHLINMEKYYPN